MEWKIRNTGKLISGKWGKGLNLYLEMQCGEIANDMFVSTKDKTAIVKYDRKYRKKLEKRKHS